MIHDFVQQRITFKAGRIMPLTLQIHIEIKNGKSLDLRTEMRFAPSYRMKRALIFRQSVKLLCSLLQLLCQWKLDEEKRQGKTKQCSLRFQLNFERNADRSPFDAVRYLSKVLIEFLLERMRISHAVHFTNSEG